MWIGHLTVLLAILGCAAYQYFKGRFVPAFATIMLAIFASIVAFGYFEALADVFISRAGVTRYPSLVPWTQLLCFALLFVLAFAGLQTLTNFLTRRPIDLGLWPERIGRVVCGIFLGLILSGLLLTALEMGPLPIKYPYQRFAQKPNKVLLNADGLATGLFGLASKGSLSSKRSFATLHPSYLDQLFLNRLLIGANISVVTGSPAIEVPSKQAAWPASEALRQQAERQLSQLQQLITPIEGTKDKPVPLPGWQISDYDLTIVRVGIRKNAVGANALIDGGTFALSQLRLICKQKGDTKSPLAGKGVNIYPIGHLKTANEMETSYLIKLKHGDFERTESVKWIDFVFCVPKGFVPVLIQFKQNDIAQVPPLIPADQAPPAATFTQPSEKEKRGPARPDRPSQKRTSPPEEPATAPEGRGLSDISRSVVGDQFDEE